MTLKNFINKMKEYNVEVCDLYFLIERIFNIKKEDIFLKSDIGINLKNINAQLYSDLCNCRYSVIDDKSFNQYLKGFKVPNIIILNDIILEDISRIKKK